MAVVPKNGKREMSVGTPRRSWLIAVLVATACFFWLVTAVGDAAPGANAEGDFGSACDGFATDGTQPFEIDPFQDGPLPYCSDHDSQPELPFGAECEDPLLYDYWVTRPVMVDSSNGTPTELCFNLVSRMAPTCESNAQWIVGVVAVPPLFDKKFGGLFQVVSDSGVTFDPVVFSSDAVDPRLVSNPNEGYDDWTAITFWAYAEGYNQRPATVNIELYGQAAESFRMAPNLGPSGLECSGGGDPAPDITAADPCESDDCSASWTWNCASEFTLDIEGGTGADEAIISTVFTRNNSQDEPIPLTDTVYGEGGWTYSKTWSTEILPGTWTAQVQVTFPGLTDPVTGADYSFTPLAKVMTTDCGGALSLDCPTLTATHAPFDDTYPADVRSGAPIYLRVYPSVDSTSPTDIEFDELRATYSIDSPAWVQAQIVNGPAEDEGGLEILFLVQGDFVVAVDSASFEVAVGGEDGVAIDEDYVQWDTPSSFACLAPSVECVGGSLQLAVSGPQNAVDANGHRLLELIEITANGESANNVDNGTWPLIWNPVASANVPLAHQVTTENTNLADVGFVSVDLPDVNSDDGSVQAEPICTVASTMSCVSGTPTFSTTPAAPDLLGVQADTSMIGPFADLSLVQPGSDDLADYVGSTVRYGLLTDNEPSTAVTFSQSASADIEVAVPDCTLNASINCEAGVPVIRASTDGSEISDTPATTVSVTNAGSDTSEGTFAPNGHLPVSNDDDGTLSYSLSANNGVTIHPATLSGRDCVLEVSQSCTNGIPQVNVPLGNVSLEDLFAVDINGSYFDLYFPEAQSTSDHAVVLVIDDTTYQLGAADFEEGWNGTTLAVTLPEDPDIVLSPVSGEDASTTETYDLVDCVIESSIECMSYEADAVHGVPTIAANPKGTPAAETGITVTSLLGAGLEADLGIDVQDAASGVVTVSNDDPDASAYRYSVQAASDVGVVVVPAELDGRDCIVEVDIFCEGGEAAMQIRAGRTGLSEVTYTRGYKDTDGTVTYEGQRNGPDFGPDRVIDIGIDPGVDGILVDLDSFDFDLLVVAGSGLPGHTLDDHMTGPSNPYPVPRCTYAVELRCSATNPGTALLDARDFATTPSEAPVVSPSISDNDAGLFVVPTQTDITVSAGGDGVLIFNSSSSDDSASEELTFSGIGCVVEAEWSMACENGEPVARIGEITPPAGRSSDISYFSTPSSVTLDRAGVKAGTSVSGSSLFTIDAEAGGSALPSGHTVSFTPPTHVVPACSFQLGATATCTSGEIAIALTHSGATPDELTVDGQIVTLDADGSTTVPAALRAMHVVSADFSDPGVAVTTSPINLNPPCRIVVDVVVECTSDTQATVRVSEGTASTGTLLAADTTVNDSSLRPFTVDAGSGPIKVRVVSANTLDANISVPDVNAPVECKTGTLDPGSVFLDWIAACKGGDASTISVTMTVGGLIIGEPSINGEGPVAINPDGSRVFEVEPGATLFVAVLVLNPQSGVVLDGPAQAPVCAVPIPPAQAPEPVITPAPPAIVVSIPETPATPGPTPEVTPEPTPDPTPEPTVEVTPDPTPEPTVEVTPDPTPEPESPDEVLVERLTPPGPQSLRQHGESHIQLPAQCDTPEIDIPGAVRLTKIDTLDDGSVLFSAEAATLQVGEYKQTIACGDTVVNVVLFVYSQIGGARGEANTISTLATAGGALALVMVGMPRIARRKELI